MHGLCIFFENIVVQGVLWLKINSEKNIKPRNEGNPLNDLVIYRSVLQLVKLEYSCCYVNDGRLYYIAGLFVYTFSYI